MGTHEVKVRYSEKFKIRFLPRLSLLIPRSDYAPANADAPTRRHSKHYRPGSAGQQQISNGLPSRTALYGLGKVPTAGHRILLMHLECQLRDPYSLLLAIGSSKDSGGRGRIYPQRSRHLDEHLVGFDPLAGRWRQGAHLIHPAVGGDDEEHVVEVDPVGVAIGLRLTELKDRVRRLKNLTAFNIISGDASSSKINLCCLKSKCCRDGWSSSAALTSRLCSLPNNDMAY